MLSTNARDVTLSGAAQRVIDLARKVRIYYEAELPKRHPDYPLIHEDEQETPPPPEQRELKDFLETLSDDTIYQLLLIMHLGRRDFGTDDLAASYDALKQTFKRPENAVSQMLGKAPLGDYLADGIEELRNQKINIDKLRLTKVKVRKA